MLIPPPVLCLLLGIAMYYFPIIGHYTANYWLIALILFCALFIATFSVVQFYRQKTTINPHHFENSTKLVTNGIYRISRNPMYLSLLLILIAWALWLGNGLAWLGIFSFISIMNRFQIQREEIYLQEKFGDDYLKYQQKVRRWL